MIYPLTICFDRYNGVYSGGLYTAWNCDPVNVPTEISDDDVTCANFWSDVENEHYCFLPDFGVGSTAEEAVENLRKKLNAVEEGHDKETQTSDIFCEENLDVVPVARVRGALGIAEDSDIFEAIAVLKKSDERAHSEMYKARGEKCELLKKADEQQKKIDSYEATLSKITDIMKPEYAGPAWSETWDDLVERIKRMKEKLREKAGENSVLRSNIDYFADLAQGRQKALVNLRDEILKVYREIFECSDGDPEGTDKETLQDILTEYKTVKESLAREREWTKRMGQKLIEIQDICER